MIDLVEKAVLERWKAVGLDHEVPGSLHPALGMEATPALLPYAKVLVKQGRSPKIFHVLMTIHGLEEEDTRNATKRVAAIFDRQDMPIPGKTFLYAYRDSSLDVVEVDEVWVGVLDYELGVG